MYSSNIKKFQKNLKESFNRRNTISIEWPDYMSSNPHLVVMDNEQKYYSKGSIKKLLKNEKSHKFSKNQNTNLKLGISKDSPFVNEYTEYHRLTKNLFDPSLEPKVNGKSKLDKNFNTHSKKIIRGKEKRQNSLESIKGAKMRRRVNEKLFSRMMLHSMSPQQQKKIKSRYDNYAKEQYERTLSKADRTKGSDVMSKNPSTTSTTICPQKRSYSIRAFATISQKPVILREPSKIKSLTKARNIKTTNSKERRNYNGTKLSKRTSTISAYNYKDGTSFKEIYQSHKKFYESIIDKNAFTDPRKKPLNQKLRTHIHKYKIGNTLTTANSMPSFSGLKSKAKRLEHPEQKNHQKREDSIISSNICDEYCNLDKDRSTRIIGRTRTYNKINRKRNQTMALTKSIQNTRAHLNNSSFEHRETKLDDYY
ncbi:unnamed protein product [Moneuplotes crassus]|uniref:Uncharacterized protein n=1 Tax=Euplotes crassus TaxID=5936 RepID=A0AAD1UGS9_EUPCR|nr:unnamed protein product [Moneuplotes crassus]